MNIYLEPVYGISTKPASRMKRALFLYVPEVQPIAQAARLSTQLRMACSAPGFLDSGLTRCVATVADSGLTWPEVRSREAVPSGG